MRTIGKDFMYDTRTNVCNVLNKSGDYLGTVSIDETNAWNVKYANDVSYLPINSALRLLGYSICKDATIE